MKRHAHPSFFLICAAIALLGCPRPPAPDEPSPNLRGDAGSDVCETACVVLVSENCEEGKATAGGLTCLDVCAIAPAMLPVACVSRARNVAEIRNCGVRCRL